MSSLSGSPISYWINSTSPAQFPSFSPETTGNVTTHAPLNITAGVAIVGGGIAGLTAAFLLKRAGKTVGILEANQIAAATSGHTTAKLTSLHQVIYADLITFSFKLGLTPLRTCLKSLFVRQKTV